MNHGQQWDIFCKVIDNFGDIGVCWRLAADLASRGQRVRLWVDDNSALGWMAPGGCTNVQVLRWTAPLAPEACLERQPCDVLVESFGCEPAPEFIAACARQASATGRAPLWINLEHLSAEAYVERCHALPSPVQGGPAAGWTKWFFYPGFTEGTGGLLREPGLPERQAAFDRSAWLAAQGIAWQGEVLVSLFCYEPDALAELLGAWSRRGLGGLPVRLLVAAGRASGAVKAVFEYQNGLLRPLYGHSMLSISYLPWLAQTEFDALLWACDLNFVRGEDSVVRALWAGKPFVWHLYPQDDGAHLDKLDAFLDMLQAPASLRRFHHAWNGRSTELQALQLDVADLAAWQACAVAACKRLVHQNDLTSKLIKFAVKKR